MRKSKNHRSLPYKQPCAPTIKPLTFERWTADGGPADGGQRTADGGRWTADGGRRTVDGGWD
ncbi:unnamed protein product, partial [Nesidiocoris tenuis]